MNTAACRGHDPELWFPLHLGGVASHVDVAAKAKAICRGCPLRAECAAAALDLGVDYGVWAGIEMGTDRHSARSMLSRIAGRPDYVRPTRVPPNCQGPCGRPLRATHILAADAPGTVPTAGHGMCSPCRRITALGVRPTRKVPA